MRASSTLLTAALALAFAAGVWAKVEDRGLLEQRVAEARRWTQTKHPLHALDAWHRVLIAAPQHGEAWVEVGVLQAEAGELAEAQNTLERAQKLKPSPVAGQLKRLTDAVAAAKVRGGSPLVPPATAASPTSATTPVPELTAGTAGAPGADPPTGVTSAARPASASFPPPSALPPEPWVSAPSVLIPPVGGAAPSAPVLLSVPAPPSASPPVQSAAGSPIAQAAAPAARPTSPVSATAVPAPPAVSASARPPGSASRAASAPLVASSVPSMARTHASAASGAAPIKLSRRERLRLEREKRTEERRAARAAQLEKKRADAIARANKNPVPGAAVAASGARTASAPTPVSPPVSAASAPRALVLPPPAPVPAAPWAGTAAPTIPPAGAVPATSIASPIARSGALPSPMATSATPSGPSAPAGFVVPSGDPGPLLAQLRTPSAMIERWTDTRAKLEALADAHPQNAQVLGALASHLSLREGTRREAIRQLESLSARNLATPDTREAWRQALMSLTPRSGDDALYVAYLSRYPDDQRVAEHLRILHGDGRAQSLDASRVTRP